MAYLPPITVLFGDQAEEQPEPVSSVCAFPERVIAEGDVRHAKRVLSEWEDWLANCDPNAPSPRERLGAHAAGAARGAPGGDPTRVGVSNGAGT